MAVLNIPVEKLVKGKKPVSPKGLTVTSYKDLIVLRKRQFPNLRTQTLLQKAWVENFKTIACWSKQPDPRAFDTATELAKGTNWYYRDVIETALSAKLHRVGKEVRVTTPTAKVGRAAAETLVNGTEKYLTPTFMVWDNNVFWNPTVNPSRLTFRSPGLYLVGTLSSFNAITGGARYVNDRHHEGIAARNVNHRHRNEPFDSLLLPRE